VPRAQKARYDRARQDEQIAREQRQFSGADCTWTQVANAPDWHCRMNGRLYRLSPTLDKMWTLCRATSVDGPNGVLIGKYRHRGDATKVVAQAAYAPEPR
jgi:hypothetical protein